MLWGERFGEHRYNLPHAETLAYPRSPDPDMGHPDGGLCD